MLLIITLASAVVSAATVGIPLIGGDFKMAYYTADGLKQFDELSFPAWERLALTVLLSLPNLFWINCLWPIGLLALRVIRGSLHSKQVVKRFNSFGWRLFANAAVDILVIPTLNFYMVLRQHSGPIQNMWSMTLDSGGLDLAMAGVLVVIICHLLQAGMEAMEETKLTI